MRGALAAPGGSSGACSSAAPSGGASGRVTGGATAISLDGSRGGVAAPSPQPQTSERARSALHDRPTDGSWHARSNGRKERTARPLPVRPSFVDATVAQDGAPGGRGRRLDFVLL